MTSPGDLNDRLQKGTLPSDPKAGAVPRNRAAKVRDIQEARAKQAMPNWAEGLLRTEKGTPKKSLANVLWVLTQHPAWKGVIAYDAFAETIVKLRPPPMREHDGVCVAGVWKESDSTRTAAWLASNVDFEPAPQSVDSAVVSVAERNAVHPVRDYLRGLVWDGTPRLNSLFVRYFGAQDGEYAQAVGSRFAISAVARVMRPGCQVDTMPILASKQGDRKSTGIAKFFGEDWFADTGFNIGDKDSFQSLKGKWCYEFSELAQLKRGEVEKVKAFVSARVDTYRPSYGRRTQDYPRQIVFCGTTNEKEFLLDRTGNRRFWPIDGSSVNFGAIEADRDQLWAEATVRFNAGEPWHVNTPELAALCAEAQQDHEVEDPWVDRIERWLLRGRENELGVSMEQVLEGLGLTPTEMARHDLTIRAGHALRKLKWEPKQRRRDGRQVRLYFPSQTPQSQQSQQVNNSDTEPASSQPDSSLSQTSQTHAYAHMREAVQLPMGCQTQDFTETESDDRDTVTVDIGEWPPTGDA